MMTDEKWEELRQEEEMAYFRADLCLSSPESYSLEEKKDICNGMMSTSKATLDAMRADFSNTPLLSCGFVAFRVGVWNSALCEILLQLNRRMNSIQIATVFPQVRSLKL